MHRWLAFVLPLALLTGCGGGPDAACDFNLPAGSGTVHACVEFTNLGSADITAADDACTKQGGKPIDACSMDNVIGFCTLSEGSVEAVEYFYTGAGVTVEIAKKACENTGTGTWTTK